MSIFGKIKDAIFGDKDEKATAPKSIPANRPATQAPRPTAQTTPPAKPQARPVVDVENHLDAMPGADRLNWRTSIVDLMKLLGIDSDYESRKALAQEMGRSDYSGSAEDNVWLHRRVMSEVAANGGKVPADMRD